MSSIETILGVAEHLPDSSNPINRRDFVKGLSALGASVFVKPETGISPAEMASNGVDSPLESRIDSYVKNLRIGGRLASTDEISVTVYDINHGKKIVSINEDVSRMAASTIKDFVMLAFYHEVKAGRQRENKKTSKHLQLMIQKSNNNSTNYFIDLLGGPSRVNSIIRQNYGFFNETRIVEKIPRGGRTYRNKRG